VAESKLLATVHVPRKKVHTPNGLPFFNPPPIQTYAEGFLLCFSSINILQEIFAEEGVVLG
jgi:hypothetical protein